MRLNETVETSTSKLKTKFNSDVCRFKKHTFNIRQYYNKAYKDCKENLQKNKAMLHMDFSENYVCKQSTEVQAYSGGKYFETTIELLLLAFKNANFFCNLLLDLYVKCNK